MLVALSPGRVARTAQYDGHVRLYLLKSLHHSRSSGDAGPGRASVPILKKIVQAAHQLTQPHSETREYPDRGAQGDQHVYIDEETVIHSITLQNISLLSTQSNRIRPLRNADRIISVYGCERLNRVSPLLGRTA